MCARRGPAAVEKQRWDKFVLIGFSLPSSRPWQMPLQLIRHRGTVAVRVGANDCLWLTTLLLEPSPPESPADFCTSLVPE
jgi:hypothetical protein